MSSLDDQIRSALDRVLESFTGQLESDLTRSGADIMRAVSEALDRAAVEGRQEAEQQLATVRQEFERQRDELQRSATDEVAVLKQTIEDLRTQLGTACLTIEDERQQREGLQAQLEHVQRDADGSRRVAEDARRELEAVRVDLTAAQRAAEEARGDSEGTHRELDAARSALAQADRLDSGLRTLDCARSLVDVLDGLFNIAHQETGRAAVFLPREGRLHVWRATGFDVTGLVVGAGVPPEESGLVGDAAQSGERKEQASDDESSLPAFAAGNGPRHAVALPVDVGGSVIAVLYADRAEADTQREPRWPTILDLMARHAGRVLEAVTVRHAAALWAPRAAGLSSLLGSHIASRGELQ